MNKKQLTQLSNLKDLAYRMYKELQDFETTTDDIADIDQIKHAIASGNAVILDTETTGLYEGEIIEIAIVEVATGAVLMNQRIKPYKGIPADAKAIHGISEADVADCPHFEDVIVEIKGHLAGRDVIVYNATYDRKMLHKSAEYADIPKVDWKLFSNWMCAMEAFAPIFGEWNEYRGNFKWQKLTTAAQYYKVEVNNAHSALGDCLMTLEVVRAMVKSETA